MAIVHAIGANTVYFVIYLLHLERVRGCIIKVHMQPNMFKFAKQGNEQSYWLAKSCQLKLKTRVRGENGYRQHSWCKLRLLYH